MDDYKYQALKMYTRARHQLVQELTREKQRFLNIVFICFSGLTQEKIFSDKFGATSMALIEEFSSLDELLHRMRSLFQGLSNAAVYLCGMA